MSFNIVLTNFGTFILYNTQKDKHEETVDTDTQQCGWNTLRKARPNVCHILCGSIYVTTLKLKNHQSGK